MIHTQIKTRPKVYCELCGKPAPRWSLVFNWHNDDRFYDDYFWDLDTGSVSVYATRWCRECRHREGGSCWALVPEWLRSLPGRARLRKEMRERQRTAAQ